MSISSSSTQYVNHDDLAFGRKIVGYALDCLAWGVALATAWSCSTILMGIIMFIIMSIVMYFLASLVSLAIFFKVPATSVESLGRNVGGAAARVSSLFTRKAPVAA